MTLAARALAPVTRCTLALLLATLAACKSAEERTPAASAAGSPAQSSDAPAGAPASAPAGASSDSLLRLAADRGRISGAESARVWMLIVSDFECPYCKKWHDDTYATLHREYVESGKVRMAYLNFPLPQHEQAMPAANAAMCAAAQDKFWQYQSALFEGQTTWAKPGDQSGAYEAIAQRVGADVPALRACMRSNAMRPLIEADKDRSSRAGVQSTPTFIVGGSQLSGALPVAEFRRVLDSALAATAK
jgi:protein-disulfide isomerase